LKNDPRAHVENMSNGASSAFDIAFVFVPSIRTVPTTDLQPCWEGRLRVEQPPTRMPVVLSTALRVVRGLTGVLFAASALAASSGCAVGSGKAKVPSFATPAAKTAPIDRPFAFLPPITLTSKDAANEDAIVRILNDVTCTGTLIAEDLVLTAHHCVAARDESGKPTGKDVDASTLEIELGGDYLSWGEVKVRAIVSPDCGYRSGNGDIAILVLKRKLIGIPTLTPRLDGPPKTKTEDRKAETIYPVGFGRCALSHDAIRREHRIGGAVEGVGLSDFVVNASICPGDSGGPAVSHETGEVVGVISSSMMDGDAATTAPSFFTRLDLWKQLFAAAQEIANGASPSELPPYRSCSSSK
jgi:V8-like Glu-specific endopeptidase